jgi:acyl-ACP thioesterase
MITEGKYRHTYTSTASDITPLYKLTPNALLMYFQDSFARLMTIHGLAAFDIVKQRRMWVITEVQIDVQPTVTYWSEDFTVELWVSELTSLRIYCDFRIVRKDNEKLIASGTSQWNILNLDTKRLEPTDFLADKLTVVPELMTASHKKVRFPKPQSVEMQMDHRATRLDLDFNFHVSNRSYVSIALLTMPDEVLASQILSSLTVHWLHETYLDDTLSCRMSRTDDDSYLHTLTNSEGVVVCELMSKWQPQPQTADVSEVLNRDL